MTRSPLRRMTLTPLLVSAFGAHAQGPAPPYTDSPTLPDSPAYKRALEVLEVVNSGDPARVRALVENALAPGPFRDRPLEAHLGFFAEAHADHGRLEVHGARSYDPPRPRYNAVLIVRSTLLEVWRAIVVDVEDAEPYRIMGIELAPARPPRDLPPAERLSDEQVVSRFGAYVDGLAAQDAFSGTVLLAKDGKIRLTRAAGIANRDFDVPVNLQTRFNLGSMNKMFTAVAAMQLVERGKLSLDDPIGKYLGTDWLSQVILDRVQVKHLLTHTSGLGSYFNEGFVRASRALFRQVDDYKPLVQGEMLAFAPGTQWSYSNTGMLIAGAVIEKAGGRDYFDLIRENVTGPAGMRSTDSYELDRVNKNLAVGYSREQTPAGPEWRNNLFEHVIRGGPAGGGYSTVEDLLRFDQALRAGKLLKKETLAVLWRAYPELSSPDYGLGFGIESSPAGRIVGHSGGFVGISAHLSMYLDDGWTVAVLSNHGGSASIVEAKARELITQGR